MKKAIAASTLAVFILAIFSLGILLGLVGKLNVQATKNFDIGICKNSVLLNSKARIPTLNIGNTEINCPTRYITFKKDSIDIESRNYKEDPDIIGCKDLSSKKGQECYLNVANERISKLLFDCWDQFAAGKLQVLSAYNTNRQCVLCSRFEFSKEVQEAFKTTIGKSQIRDTDFYNTEEPSKDFTLDNYMRSKSPPYHTITYYEFTLDPTDIFNIPFYDYNLIEPYAIVFKALNENQGKVLLKSAWDNLKNGDLALTTEDGKYYVNTLSLVKYSEVIKECDTLE